MNDSHRTLPQQSVEKNIQFHARVENGIVVKREGFFFPGTGFRYSKNKERGNPHDQKNSVEMVEVRFMRDEANLSKVVYAFFKLVEKPSTQAFLKLTHPDYVPEKSLGVYYDLDELSTDQRLAVAVMAFLKISRHKETVRRFSYFETAQAKADAQSAHADATKKGKSESQQSIAHSLESPTFSLWQDFL